MEKALYCDGAPPALIHLHSKWRSTKGRLMMPTVVMQMWLSSGPTLDLGGPAIKLAYLLDVWSMLKPAEIVSPKKPLASVRTFTPFPTYCFDFGAPSNCSVLGSLLFTPRNRWLRLVRVIHSLDDPSTYWFRFLPVPTAFLFPFWGEEKGEKSSGGHCTVNEFCWKQKCL